MKITILSLENQTDADAIAVPLQAIGHDCTTRTPQSLLEDLRTAAPCDLLIVCGSRVGFDLAAWIATARETARANDGRSFPVLAVIDASASPAGQLVNLLAAGLDDYLVQPVRRTELAMRVDVLLRRAWPEKMQAAQVQVGPFVFDTLSGTVRRDGRPVELAHKEFELALLFFRHLNQPLSRATLLDTLWSGETAASSTSRTVDTHVSRVRNKLGLQEAGGFRLVPVYGYGYVLASPEKSPSPG